VSNEEDREQERIIIRRLRTGIPGLDEILGGGLPEYSFNIIAGGPGCGKTTLVHQFMFENGSPEAPALYFTILGEPAIKMLRYQQQFTFFDQSKLETAVRFINLSHFVLEQNLGAVLEEIVRQVEAHSARIVVVDSFRTVVRSGQASSTEMELQGFIQRLALHLTSWQATSFLVGEYVEGEIRDNPVFTVADGLVWLYQSVERNSIVRKLQVMKLRGQESIPGLHTFRITQTGLQTFPRTLGLGQESGQRKGERRVSTGISALDALMGGGIPEFNSLLLAGPSGSGKSIIASQFIAEGLRQNEPGVVAIFEELPADFVNRAAKFGLDFDTPQKKGTLKVIYIRPLDLSVDETVHEIVRVVKEIRAQRVVLDSLVGFEMALAPDFRHEFRESLYRMVAVLTRLGVTVVSTVEIEDNFTSMGLSNFAISFLADDIVRLRYVSINGQLRKMLLVVKMRGSAHSIDMTEYTITGEGLIIGAAFRGYQGLISGIPGPWPFAYGDAVPEPRQEGEPTPRPESKEGRNE
jgi:circadian clock protein KaiC